MTTKPKTQRPKTPAEERAIEVLMRHKRACAKGRDCGICRANKLDDDFCRAVRALERERAKAKKGGAK